MKNENRSGYKKTKVSWIPEEWSLTTIESICERAVDCVNRTAPITEKETPYLMIRTTNVRHGKISLKDTSCVEKHVYKEWTRRLTPKQGDILLTREAPVGEVGCISGDELIFLGQRIMHYRVNSEIYSATFLLNFLLSPITQKHLQRISFGSTAKHIQVGDALSIPVPTLPLPEQEAIAEVLECWDQGIRNLELKIEKKRNVKKGLMQKLLSGQSRLPGFSGEWETVSIKSITTLIKDGTHGTHTNVEDGIPLLSAKDVFNGKLKIPSDCRQISRDEYELIHKGYRLQDGDILITIVGSLGRVALVSNFNDSYTFQRSVAILRPNISSLPCYLFHKFQDNSFFKELKKRENKGAQGGVYLGEISKIKLKLPSLDEQKAIAEVLSDADLEIEKLEAKLERWKDQKKYLLNELVTGSIRVGAA